MIAVAMTNLGNFRPCLKLHRKWHSGEVSKPMPCQQSRTISPITETGTEPAKIHLTLGVPVHLTLPKQNRGGARNTASRQSDNLTANQVANLIAGASHAGAIGLPFTRMITIHWQAAGIPLEGMARATGRFTDLLTKAVARHGHKSAWLWVHENGHGKGGHVHILAHVPPLLAPLVKRLQKGWLRTITGQPYIAKVIKSDPIGGRLGLETGNPELHAVNLEAALAYVLKGASHEAGPQFGLGRLEPGGLVIGKRCSTSQNIGPAARMR